MNKNLVSNSWISNGITYKFTWYPGDNIESFVPFTQVYGVCFNKKGEILIQKFKDKDWCLPGGTVEKGESATETMEREFVEEVDVTIKNSILLGGQRVQFLVGHNPHPDNRGGDDFYQLRYYCEVKEILHQTPDPDENAIRDRLFVSPQDITKYLNWGNTGNEIFEQATALYHRLHSTSRN